MSFAHVDMFSVLCHAAKDTRGVRFRWKDKEMDDRNGACAPGRQARSARPPKSGSIVPQGGAARKEAAAAAALVLVAVLVLPRLMYLVIAPMKGWC